MNADVMTISGLGEMRVEQALPKLTAAEIAERDALFGPLLTPLESPLPSTVTPTGAPTSLIDTVKNNALLFGITGAAILFFMMPSEASPRGRR